MTEHLGGHVPGGDEATYYPTLWDALVNAAGVRSVIDVGCGDGVAVDHFLGRGCEAYGVDGVPHEHPRIAQHDYTQGRWRISWPSEQPPWPLEYDLAWSCEFVEHVEERYVPNFMDTFARARTVLLTHAEPGQGGHHHVNCQPREYWIGAMAAIGYRLDTGLTAWTRSLAADNPSPWNHYVRSGLAFVRR